MQNRDALGIPMDVPEPEPPRSTAPSSRRSHLRQQQQQQQGDRRVQPQLHNTGLLTSGLGAGVDRRKSPQPGAGGNQTPPSLAYGIGNTLTSRFGSYADQYMSNRNLPELFSKGLSDINGVVSNTVSEIRVRTFSRIFVLHLHDQVSITSHDAKYYPSMFNTLLLSRQLSFRHRLRLKNTFYSETSRNSNHAPHLLKSPSHTKPWRGRQKSDLRGNLAHASRSSVRSTTCVP